MHEALPVNERAAASAAQRIVQVELAAGQLTLQLAVHATWQSVPSPHETLPLAPTVTSQVESGAHEMLHDSPQVPRQTAAASHASEQLPPAPPQLDGVKSHIVPPLHEQLAPEQVGARGPAVHPEQRKAASAAEVIIIVVARVILIVGLQSIVRWAVAGRASARVAFSAPQNEGRRTRRRPAPRGSHRRWFGSRRTALDGHHVRSHGQSPSTQIVSLVPG